MMKQVTLAAPRSTAATSGGRTRAAFRPSLRSAPLAGLGLLRPSGFGGVKLRASSSASGRRANFSMRLVFRSRSLAGAHGRGEGDVERGACAGAHGHRVGIAQVDALEADFEDARALVEPLELHQRV